MSWMNRPILRRLVFALVLVLLALGGCSNEPDAPAAPKTCPAGELLLDDGRCQPAGLPLDMQCPPGELALENGGCQPAGLPPDMACPPGEWEMEGGGCAPAGLPPDMPCPPGEMEKPGGGCEPAGIPPEMCGQGFVPDGNRGCEAILPAEACPDGMMAVPGDTVCREVAPCGTGDWGDIPVDATTQFVNAAYPLNDSNGSQAKPWKTIKAGVAAAANGAIVAVAAGTYSEDVTIQGKAVKVWGRCPGMVEIESTGINAAAIVITGSAANTSEVRWASITGPKIGVTVHGSSKVVLDRMRIHDTGYAGIEVKNASASLGALTLADSLVERTTVIGVYATGATATIERSVVRETKSGVSGTEGFGIYARHNGTFRANVTLNWSLIEKNHEVGILVMGSDIAIDATAVRETLPDGSGKYGFGIMATNGPALWVRAHVVMRHSLVEKNNEIGVLIWASDVLIDASVMRQGKFNANKKGGGIQAFEDPDAGHRANLTVRASLIEKHPYFGIHVVGSDALIEATLVRETLPDGDAECGGIVAIDDAGTKQRANVTVRGSIVEKSPDAGIHVQGSDALVEATVVRETQPDVNGEYGQGLHLQGNHETGQRTKVAVRASLIEDNYATAVFVAGADALIATTVVRETVPQGDGTMGRGIEVQSLPGTGQRSNVTVLASLIENNRGIGVHVSASDVVFDATVVRETQADVSGSGRGINVQNDGEEESNVTVRGSLIENNRGIGIFVEASTALIEATAVRGTKPEENGTPGRGINVQYGANMVRRSQVTMRALLVEKNHGLGIYVSGSDGLIEATVVRETLPTGNETNGIGIAIEGTTTGQPGDVTVRASLVEKNQDGGIFVDGSDARIEATVVRESQRNKDGIFGRGIQVQSGTKTGVRASVGVSASLIEKNHEAGIFVLHSDAKIESTLVRGTVPSVDAQFGDGIVAASDQKYVSKWGSLPPSVSITGTRVESNTRAGIANFGGSIQLVSSVLTCHKFDMNGENEAGYSWFFDGSHDNLCGCPEPTGTCGAVSAGLEAPPILDAPGPLSSP